MASHSRGGAQRVAWCGVLSPLRHRNFALLWAGQFVSLLGDGIFLVALPLEALRISHGPALLSFVVAARMAPMLVFLLPAGAITDRISRRLVMFSSDLLRGAAVGLVGALVMAHLLSAAGLVVMAAAFGTADAFFFPASTAIVPEIVPAEVLTEASALSFTSESLAQSLVGPALGGILVGVIGVAGCLLVDSASFVVSAVFLAVMRRLPAMEPKGEQGPSLLGATKEGLTFTFQRTRRWLWVTILAAALGNFAAFTPLVVLTPLLVEQTLRGSPAALGYVFAWGGLGGLVGVLLAGKTRRPRRRVTVMWVMWTLAAGMVALRAVAPDLAWLSVLVFASSFFLSWGSVPWTPLMQDLVPRALLGRVSSVDWLFSLSLSPLGGLFAGVLAGVLGVRTAFLLGGGIGLATGLVLFIPGVRDPDREGADPQNLAAGVTGE
ncbi:MAG: MFS transporter [Acidimicrobiales bacterium]